MGHRFEKYCKDYKNIENFEKAKADNFKGWCCHHRKGVDIPTEKLKALGMYYNRPPEELIFLTRNEHSIIHSTGENNAMYGKRHSTEAKKKNSEAHKGKKHSEESKKKMSDERKGKPKSEEWRKKISEATKGENNPFYGKHHSAESKKKMSESQKGKHIGNTATKGMHWYNNGKINKCCYECPEGFVPGRIKKP